LCVLRRCGINPKKHGGDDEGKEKNEKKFRTAFLAKGSGPFEKMTKRTKVPPLQITTRNAANNKNESEPESGRGGKKRGVRDVWARDGKSSRGNGSKEIVGEGVGWEGKTVGELNQNGRRSYAGKEVTPNRLP